MGQHARIGFAHLLRLARAGRLAVCELLVMGAIGYSSGLFVLPLQAEFHLSRAGANRCILLLFLGGALASPRVGKLLDHWSVRVAVRLGAILSGLILIVTLLFGAQTRKPAYG